jgi:glycosyltransferase involved in cell wall biosynthesis
MGNNLPNVSVCLPTYCGEKHLKECLESILCQTFCNFELLIIDDCSSDLTIDIINNYSKYDSRIRILRNERNLGIASNWNRCIELAQGQWIKYVFQDDLLAPNCLEIMLKATESKKEMIFCRRDFIFEDVTDLRLQEFYINHAHFIDNLFGNLIDISPKSYINAVLKYPKVNLVGEPTNTLLHRNIFHRFGNFNQNLIQIIDQEMWTRGAIHTGLTYVPETLASFRVHKESTTSKNHSTKIYRANVLDYLVLLHDMALHPIYKPFRKITLELSQPIDFNQQLRQFAYSAFLQAIESSDEAILAEWEYISDSYPILKFMAEFMAQEIFFEELS